MLVPGLPGGWPGYPCGNRAPSTEIPQCLGKAVAGTSSRVTLGVSNGARLGSGHREEGESEMFSFRKAAKQAGRGDRQRPGDAAEQAARDEAASAQAVRLRDLDPVHTFTATAELRRKDARYAPIWPSDIPQRRRRGGK
jgi:hypothetical protein